MHENEWGDDETLSYSGVFVQRPGPFQMLTLKISEDFEVQEKNDDFAVSPKFRTKKRKSCFISDRKIVEQTILEMERPVNADITLDEFSDYSQVSKYDLIRKFKKTTGLTPKKFHNALKLQMAKNWLLEDKLSVTELCFELGYSSLGSFVTSFTKNVGIPPNRYRKAMIEFFSNFEAIPQIHSNKKCANSSPLEIKVKFTSDISASFCMAAIFNHAYPAGIPKYCRVFQPSTGCITIPKNSKGYLLICAAGHNQSFFDLLSNGPDVVGKLSLGDAHRKQTICMRKRDVFDPPVLIGLPVIFANLLGI